MALLNERTTAASSPGRALPRSGSNRRRGEPGYATPGELQSAIDITLQRFAEYPRTLTLPVRLYCRVER
jgi:hypothetical protein